MKLLFPFRFCDAVRRVSFCTKQMQSSKYNTENLAVAFEEPKFDDDDSSSFVHITTPQRMDNAIRRRLVSRRIEEAEIERRRRLGTPIIACTRPAYNLFRGRQMLSKNLPLTALASHGWKHSRSKGDCFTINAFSKKPFFFESPVSDGETCSLSELSINSSVLERLCQVWSIERATNVQQLVIPHILQRKNVQFASESGSGKTLSYLLPLIEFSLRENWQKEIRSLILAPSRELVRQINSVISQIALPSFRSEENELNVVVTTPNNFIRKFTSEQSDQLSMISHVVFDESDTLFDDSFAPVIADVFRLLQGSNNQLAKQFIFASATVPQNLREVLSRFVPNDKLISFTTSRVHRLATHISHKFVRCGPSQKPDVLTKLARKISVPTIIFCNRSPAVGFVVRLLIENGIPAEKIGALDGRLEPEERDLQWDSFARGDRLILVATDLASRGLDTPHVRHVVNFDLPRHMSDYIHRTGRLGRVSPTCDKKSANFLVTNFVTYQSDVELCWQLESAARQAAIGAGDDSEELPGVDANIKRHLKKVADEREAKRCQKLQEDLEDPQQKLVPPFPSKFLGSENGVS